MIDKVSPRSSLALVAMAAILVACPRVEPINEQPGEPKMGPDRELTFEVVADGIHAPVDAGQFVYRDEEEWAPVARQLRDIEREPAFDDEETVLLAAFDATTGGYTLYFESVEVVDGEVVATYTIRQPGPNCMVTQALTRPYQAVAVEGLPGADVRFERRTETYSC